MIVTTLLDERRADTAYRSRREARYAALRLNWRIAEGPKQKRMALCRRVGNGDGVMFRVKGAPGEPGARAGIAGLQTCGSTWGCPVCSESINAQRQADVEHAVGEWMTQGGTVLFSTFTLRHKRTDSLEHLWDGIGAAYRKMLQSKKWKTLIKGHHGLEHYIRLVEVTHGDRNGWHPHLHVLLFLRTADNVHYVK